MKSGYIVITLVFFSFGAKSSSDFSQLDILFSQWRIFEVPPLHELAPAHEGLVLSTTLGINNIFIYANPAMAPVVVVKCQCEPAYV